MRRHFAAWMIEQTSPQTLRHRSELIESPEGVRIRSLEAERDHGYQGFSHSASMLLPSEGFDAGEVLRAVEAERCTALHGVPTMFIAEMDHPTFEQRDLSSLRTGIVAGAPCPIEMMKRLVNYMGLAEITIAYGMTETRPISFHVRIDYRLERRVATDSRVHPHLP